MNRYYYGESLACFCEAPDTLILGKLTQSHNFKLLDLQKNAWISQISILKDQLAGLAGYIYFEFSIPRMGKRVDNIVIIGDCIFVLEFKVGSNMFHAQDKEQVTDYVIDLKNFHEGSHDARIVPILISTEAETPSNSGFSYENNIFSPILVGNNGLREVIKKIDDIKRKSIDPNVWVNAKYKPTPTIIEAAKALYDGHKVEDISRSDADAINLSDTAKCINRIIDQSKSSNSKSICFVTGVPGSGKTLAGLNIAIERNNIDKNEHAVYLSGNGPLVQVLREALARDEVERARMRGEKISKKESYRKSSLFVQNIHHFRDEYLNDNKAPIEKVVIFDEAQRAWTNDKASEFMKRKRGVSGFNKSEPNFLISVMDRHCEACTIVCLLGGGQEINTGEAGIAEWFKALRDSFPNWNIYFSSLIANDDNYITDHDLIHWINENGKCEKNLHLGVSLRSFRSEKLSEFIKNLLNLNIDKAKSLFAHVKKSYPMVITRDIDKARAWLKNMARGSERYGLVASAGAVRLVPCGLNVKNDFDPANWFLNDKNDIRSSYFMEQVATEFDIQGLELDWVGVCWDANFSYQNDMWLCSKFSGTKWTLRNSDLNKEYLKNSYRVLLTRARQGMVIFVPRGSEEDLTRLSKYYDGTYDYLKNLGLDEI